MAVPFLLNRCIQKTESIYMLNFDYQILFNVIDFKGSKGVQDVLIF